jgi:hypothetical protein
MLRPGICKIFIALVVMLLNCLAGFAQDSTPTPTAEPQLGSVVFTAQVEINKETVKLDRKRFYLVRGSRQQHAEFIKQITEMPVTSRDCYYANLNYKGRKISDNLFCWLKEEHDCETPYCREVKTKEEALSIPEFASAYNQGMREYGRSTLALKWITTNLPDELRIGFYQQQKPIMKQLIDLAKNQAQEATQGKKGSASLGEGFQSIMTDRLGNAYFLDVDVVPPEKKKTETYLITNLMPIIYGDTGYIWTCEIEVDPTRPFSKIVLKNYIQNKKCNEFKKKITETCSLPDCSKQSEKPTT